MTGTELRELARDLHVNPYLLGYALATGAKTVQEAWQRDGGGAEYLAWNERVWCEQAKVENITREFVSISAGAENRHCDLIASKITVRP